MNNAFWAGKKVFITGHTGFKGSWLSLWLTMLGAKVTGYALPPSSPKTLFEQANISEGIVSIYDNILNISSLAKILQQVEPDIVFHLAAQSLVQYSYQNPVETYHVNVQGTVNVLEAIRNVASVKAIIVVTSDKCYENQEWVWGYRETEPLGGFDPYSSSKACTELVAAAYRASYFNKEIYSVRGVGLATVRAGNVIGGGDWTISRLIPDLITSFMNQQTGILRHPKAYRPWQYVLDVLQGYLMLAEQLYLYGPPFAEAWNFGPTEDNIRPVSWIATRLAALWGKGATWKSVDAGLPHEANCLKLDSNKSREFLQWYPKMDIDNVLKTTLSWYQAYHDKKEMRHFSQQQIQNYMNEDNL